MKLIRFGGQVRKSQACFLKTGVASMRPVSGSDYDEEFWNRRVEAA